MSRVQSHLGHIIRQAAILVATVCFFAGMGSIASADEFQVRGADGQILSNTRLEIRNGTGNVINIVTDNAGRFAIPYRGRVAVYQIEQTSGGSATGSLLLDGRAGIKTVRLR
jgi:hypothetical protein